MSARNTATISFGTTITLNETEIRALDALVGYGDDAFIKAFKEKLGESYIRNNTAGLKSLFKAVREQVIPAMHDIETARRDLREAMKRREEQST